MSHYVFLSDSNDTSASVNNVDDDCADVAQHFS